MEIKTGALKLGSGERTWVWVRGGEGSRIHGLEVLGIHGLVAVGNRREELKDRSSGQRADGYWQHKVWEWPQEEMVNTGQGTRFLDEKGSRNSGAGLLKGSFMCLLK